jgi:serine protease Do
VALAKSAKEKNKEKARAEAPGTESGNGYIGVYMQDLTDDVRRGLDLEVKKGVLVSGVEDDAPAALAGVEEGDVIVRFNGKEIAAPDELRGAVGAVAPGTEAKIELVRDGEPKVMTVTVGKRPGRHASHWESDEDFDPVRFASGFAMFGGPRLGIQAHELEDDGLAAYFGAQKGEGLLVLSVEDESMAGKAGVKPGDIISRVGDQTVDDVQDVPKALRDLDEGDPFDITVLRQGKSQSLKATMDHQPGEFAFRAPRAETFRWHAPQHAPRVNREWMQNNGDELRRELDNLKRELRELKEELEERNDG